MYVMNVAIHLCVVWDVTDGHMDVFLTYLALNASEDTAAPRWNLLRGRLLMTRSEWSGAAGCLLLAEADHPEAIPLLEICFRELGDFRRAYEYACKQR